MKKVKEMIMMQTYKGMNTKIEKKLGNLSHILEFP